MTQNECKKEMQLLDYSTVVISIYSKLLDDLMIYQLSYSQIMSNKYPSLFEEVNQNNLVRYTFCK